MIDRIDTSPFFPEDNDVVITLFSWDTLPPEDGRFMSLHGIAGNFLTPGLLSGLHGFRSSNHVIGHIKYALARQGVLQHFSIKASEIIVTLPRDCSFTQMLDRKDALQGPLINLKRLKAKAVKEIMRLCSSPPAASAGFLPALRSDPAPFFQRFFEDPAYQGVQAVYWDCPGSAFGAGLNPTELFSVATVRPGFARTLRGVLPPRPLLSERARWNKEICLKEIKDKLILE